MRIFESIEKKGLSNSDTRVTTLQIFTDDQKISLNTVRPRTDGIQQVECDRNDQTVGKRVVTSSTFNREIVVRIPYPLLRRFIPFRRASQPLGPHRERYIEGDSEFSREYVSVSLFRVR